MVKSKGSAFGPPPRSFGALLVPDISSEFYKAQVTYLDGTPLLLAGLISTGQGCRNSLFQIDLKYSRLKVPFFLFLSSSLQNPSNPKVGTSPTAWATTWAVWKIRLLKNWFKLSPGKMVLALWPCLLPAWHITVTAPRLEVTVEIHRSIWSLQNHRVSLRCFHGVFLPCSVSDVDLWSCCRAAPWYDGWFQQDELACRNWDGWWRYFWVVLCGIRQSERCFKWKHMN